LSQAGNYGSNPSKRAIQVNIAIMRALVKLREILATHKEVTHKLEEIEHIGKTCFSRYTVTWKPNYHLKCLVPILVTENSWISFARTWKLAA
jgi:hypothetical protein